MAKKKKESTTTKTTEPTVVIGYQMVDESGEPLDVKLVPTRHFLGVAWKQGDEYTVPAKFKNAIDDDMKSLGFYLK